ncbi:Hsp20/alpha crystallin family protein [Tropicimonas sp. IMCC6043]|uniref:Hsp20/alpha crystallin family protein n=1 Tax=Tropicimonas sp. IMCC6043 TaxID=2510645 RepID=UPI00101B68DB|nr:Hsp20/alpha crystallin family protein [Tropicimonas sp. IMCC6043]RYH07357.1 Hsp20/alpha crystallin family protein [Tropicimonas sp. IMCC6043]
MLTPASSFFRYDPFADLDRIARGMNRAFPRSWATPTSFPAVNVWRSGDAIAISSELPGVELDDIEITVKDNVLTLSGERKAPEAPEGARWHLRERSYGKFSRTVQLPYAVDSNKVEARFRDGVLQVALHRPEEDKPRRIEIKAA